MCYLGLHIFKLLQLKSKKIPASTSEQATGPSTSQNVRSRMDSSDSSSKLFLGKSLIPELLENIQRDFN